ncbi:hypothetical protein TWF173_004599 [Orbilia oligospora]|nr:hypothetical protein TWF173_004599 [Orbilia oligospora]
MTEDYFQRSIRSDVEIEPESFPAAFLQPPIKAFLAETTCTPQTRALAKKAKGSYQTRYKFIEYVINVFHNDDYPEVRLEHIWLPKGVAGSLNLVHGDSPLSKATSELAFSRIHQVPPIDRLFSAYLSATSSQLKFVEVACRKDFEGGKENVIKLPEVQLEVMIKVLAWLYRAEPEVPDSLMDDEPTSIILDILNIANFLQIDGLVDDYSRTIEIKLRALDPVRLVLIEARDFGSYVKVMNKIYKAYSSIK